MEHESAPMRLLNDEIRRLKDKKWDALYGYDYVHLNDEQKRVLVGGIERDIIDLEIAISMIGPEK